MREFSRHSKFLFNSLHNLGAVFDEQELRTGLFTYACEFATLDGFDPAKSTNYLEWLMYEKLIQTFKFCREAYELGGLGLEINIPTDKILDGVLKEKESCVFSYIR
ncbi:hypothetical protein HN832_01040 [archaeon]|jgi:hypothetical protein|nr:hypothetical protein [archaeon]MBT4373797.1 hypothetical protein [archaeon]MBT4532263.1 hypothetical protein [archaeon]MBT7001088.1 hypothetical protein [archaeon]MBT7281977.1 hypothetical protein [archaeon]